MPISNFKEWIEHSWPYASLWAIWWVVMYLNQIRKWTPFKVSMFLISIIVAWWIWMVVHDFVPESLWDYKFWIISMIWSVAFPIFDWITTTWLWILLKAITLFLNRIVWRKQ